MSDSQTCRWIRRALLPSTNRVCIVAQRRDGRSDRALLDIVRRIGLLQLDSISVVARSHYLVMLSRAGLYDPADLDALLYPDRRLFEAGRTPPA